MNEYDTLLIKFVGDKDNKDLCAPFLIGENVIATDAHKLIEIPKHFCEGEYGEGRIKKLPEWAALDTQIEIPVSDFFKAYEKFTERVEEKILVSGEVITCDECKGTGQVEWEYKHHTDDFDCPVCNGIGEDDQRVFRKTGKSNPEWHSVLKIKSLPFYYGVIKFVTDTATYLGVDSVAVTHMGDEKLPRVWVNVGEVRVLVMGTSTYSSGREVVSIM